MNIAQAKEYIKDTVCMYLKKDEFGDYRIPVMRQRPIFLLGAPGIGKTAVMSQVASELNIALVSYSMTHHTRQSALGLPFIEDKQYGGESYKVSEYTMSEIIASIYDTMEESGIKEGILFLDEINCVSETLYPSMLQFLQFKVFGKHSVPEGWVIVTAGNPGEFNKAVREFDVVTLDRLKVLSVEADYPAWKKYASDKGLHGAVLNFLDSNKDYFYMVETTAYGKSYVTARGWEDLSDIICLYEEENKRVDENLIGQYLRNETVVKEFSAFYDLYNKYRKQYDVEAIFEGKTGEYAKQAAHAPMDERLALTGMLADRVKSEIKDIMDSLGIVKEIRASIDTIADDTQAKKLADARRTILQTKSRAGSLTAPEKRHHKKIIDFYEQLMESMKEGQSPRDYYNSRVLDIKSRVGAEQVRVQNLFEQMAEIFGAESNEMMVLMTELTVNPHTAGFFASFKNDAYSKYNSLLMVGDRRENLRKEILELL